MCVVFTHTQEWAQGGYGMNINVLRRSFGQDGNYYFASLPGIQLFFAGGPLAVALFFIMSGYVLSYKPYKLILAHDQESLTKCISSAIFRRWFRLFLPIFAVNFIWVSIWYLGVHNVRPTDDYPAFSSSYRTELLRLFNVMLELSSFFGPKERARFRIYNPPMWTIPDEFQGSMVVYVSLLGLAHFTTRLRLASEFILCTYLLYLHQISLALFVAGMIICHIDALKRAETSFGIPRLASLEHMSWMLWYVAFLLGLLLATLNDENLGHRNAYQWTTFAAAALMMISVPRISWMKRLLETRSCQFLGRISYALYLTHLHVLWVIGGRIFAIFGRIHPAWVKNFGAEANLIPLPNRGPLGMELNVVVPAMLFFSLAAGVAHLATRFIDDPSVKFAQWLYRKGTMSQEEYDALPRRERRE